VKRAFILAMESEVEEREQGWRDFVVMPISFNVTKLVFEMGHLKFRGKVRDGSEFKGVFYQGID
jgi:hypothetical protein